MAGTKSRNKRTARSKVTGKEFNIQDRKIRNHGPLTKRATYQNAIIQTINSDFMEQWRTTEELAWEATKTIPRHWKQISVYVLGQILRPLLADGYIAKIKNSSNVSSYKRRRFIN